MIRLNPHWKIEVDEKISSGSFDFVYSLPLAKQHIITVLTQRNIPHAAINCGAGVMRITNKPELMKCCPKCNGKGVVA